LTAPKKKRGGQPKVDPVVTVGRAYDFELKLKQIWTAVGTAIVNARVPEDITEAFKDLAYHRDRLAVDPLPRLMIEAINDRDFPKINPEKQIRFIAQSIAGWGYVSIARSRQICRKARKTNVQDGPRTVD
jgi:hypothetical protein